MPRSGIPLFRLAALAGLTAGAMALAETYTYDDAGRLAGVVYDDPDRTLIRFQRDANGNLLRQEKTTEDVFADGFEASP